MRHKALIMCVAMFYIAVCLICGKNKETEIDDFGAIFGGMSWQTTSKFNTIVCGKSSTVTYHV